MQTVRTLGITLMLPKFHCTLINISRKENLNSQSHSESSFFSKITLKLLFLVALTLIYSH